MLRFPAIWRWLPNACSGSLVVFWVLSCLIVLLQSYILSLWIVGYVRLWRICFFVCFSLPHSLQVSCGIFQNPTDMPLEPCIKSVPEYPYSLVSPFILSKDMVCSSSTALNLRLLSWRLCGHFQKSYAPYFSAYGQYEGSCGALGGASSLYAGAW